MITNTIKIFDEKKLEKKIRKIIEEMYCCEFNRPLEVKKIDSCWILKLYLHNMIFAPLTIMIDCEDERQFIKYIKKELASRNLTRSDFLKISKNEE